MIPVGALARKGPALVFDRVTMCIPPSVFLLDERVFPALGILRVAAVLEKAGIAIEMLDLSGVADYEDAVEAYIRASGSRAVCLTATTPQMPAAKKIVDVVRRLAPDARLVLGGPHPTLVHAAMRMEQKAGRVARGHTALEKLESLFDVVVAGDGEEAVFVALSASPPKLVDADDPKTPLFMTSAVYNESPWPARHLIDIESYRYIVDGRRAGNAIFQLGCPFACNFSLTGDALISTDRGFERLEDLVDAHGWVEKCVHGGVVWANPVNGRVATRDGWVGGVEVVDEGIRPVFEVGVENGLKVRATAEHPFLVVDGEDLVWREVRQLKIGDQVVLKDPQRQWPKEYVRLPTPNGLSQIPPGRFQRRAEFKTPSVLTPDVAWLAGFVIGDGCLPMDRRPSIHVCVTPGVRKKLTRIVREAFNVKFAVNRSSVTNKMKHGWIHSRLVQAFFTETLDMRPEEKLRIPQVFLDSPKDVLVAFIRGLFDADAYIEATNGEYLVTVSATLAREVANAILMLGDIPNINFVEAKSGGRKTGFSHYRVSRLNNDRIPTQRALYRSGKSGKWYWRTPRDPKHFLGIRRRTLRESGLTHPLDIDGNYYVRVESVTRCLPERVYDLRVPGSHSFLADGLVSHNCGGRNSSMLRRIRTRTTESIISELEFMFHTYGFRAWMAHDDELNVNKNVVELMNEIDRLQKRLGVEFRFRGFIKAELFNEEQAEAMYRAGFRWLLCGFEAADPRILENINKKATLEDNARVVEICHKFGLQVKALMSVGHAGETRESIMAVKDWLLEVKPADFDCTIISTYPGTPYYDEALPHPSLENVWTYTCKKSGDRLHSYDIDYLEIADYYKGDPEGGYKSYVFTDHLAAEEIVRLRGMVEREVRSRLNIQFNPGAPGIRYEHSMGANGGLPPLILRKST